MRGLAVTHDNETTIWFQGKWNWHDSEIDCELSVFLFVKLFCEPKISAIFGLGFLKESSNDFLNVFDGNLNFLLSIYFSLVENILKAGAYIGDLSFFVSNANERSLSDFEFVYVGNEKKFLTYGTDGSLELK